MSSLSLHFFYHITTNTLIRTLTLPEIFFSGNTIELSLRDKSCNIYALTDNSTVVVYVQYQVVAERSHVVAKLLIGEQIVLENVLILDLVQSRNFCGKISSNETFALKLETTQLKKRLGDGSRDSSLLKGLDYFPLGSVVDGLSVALLGRCEMKKIKGTLYVSWREFSGPVASLVKSLLLKDALPGLEYPNIVSMIQWGG